MQLLAPTPVPIPHITCELSYQVGAGAVLDGYIMKNTLAVSEAEMTGQKDKITALHNLEFSA